MSLELTPYILFKPEDNILKEWGGICTGACYMSCLDAILHPLIDHYSDAKLSDPTLDLNDCFWL